MNQQRARRFRAAKEARELKAQKEARREDFRKRGIEMPEEESEGFHFDSNTITPGTQFMADVTEALRFYIANRMRRKGWKDV